MRRANHWSIALTMPNLYPDFSRTEQALTSSNMWILLRYIACHFRTPDDQPSLARISTHIVRLIRFNAC
jgi:hypothetical protein